MIEVLAAITVFGIVAAGATVGTISTIRGNMVSRDATVAAALIQDKIEQLRALDPSTNPADLTSGLHNDPLSPLNDLGQTGGKYTRTWTVARNTPSLNMAQVTVTVTWADPAARSLVSSTFLCLTPTCSW